MDSSKFYEFFQPELLEGERVHIIGCGAVGSTIAELLARFGITDFVLYDFDVVESHNIANQMFRNVDIGKKKTKALTEILTEINPDITVATFDEYTDQLLDGYVFLAVDSIDLRNKIVKGSMDNLFIKAMFDVRIRLTDSQAFAARWNSYDEKRNLVASMNFTDEEANAQNELSACNMVLSVAPTVRLICGYTVTNFINLLLGKEFKKMILVEAFNFNVDAF